MNTKELEIKGYKEVDDEVIEILASDESVDRDNDIIKADGWETANWLKTGSLLYGHDPSSPFNVVGTAHGAKIKDGKLYLYSKLAAKGTSDTHDTIRSLLSQKILKGVSVGFKAKEYAPNDVGGYMFTKQELLEISLTPVPANSNAQVLMKSSDEVRTALLAPIKQDIVEEVKVDLNSMTLDELKDYVKNEVQEETQVVEPEPKTSPSKETRFLNLINRIGE